MRKENGVTIVQIIQGATAGFIYGLGDDQKIYVWHYGDACWYKHQEK